LRLTVRAQNLSVFVNVTVLATSKIAPTEERGNMHGRYEGCEKNSDLIKGSPYDPCCPAVKNQPDPGYGSDACLIDTFELKSPCGQISRWNDPSDLVEVARHLAFASEVLLDACDE